MLSSGFVNDAAVPPPTGDLPSVHWSEEALARRYPRRRHGLPPLILDETTAWSEIQAVFASIAPRWARSPSLQDPELAPLCSGAAARLEGAMPRWGAPADAALVALILDCDGKGDAMDACAHAWVAAAGVSFALQALLASHAFDVVVEREVP